MGLMVKYPDLRDGTTLFDFYGVPIPGGGVGWPSQNGSGAGNLTAQTALADTVGYHFINRGTGGTSLNDRGSGGLALTTTGGSSGGIQVTDSGPGGIVIQEAGTNSLQIITTNTTAGMVIEDLSTNGIAISSAGEVTITNAGGSEILFAPINHVVTVVSNAGTVPATSKLSTFTNSSAAAMAITLSTAFAVDGQPLILRIFDFSNVPQTLAFFNTENTTTTVPASSRGSTTIPTYVGFIYNGTTSKFDCVAVS